MPRRGVSTWAAGERAPRPIDERVWQKRESACPRPWGAAHSVSGMPRHSDKRFPPKEWHKQQEAGSKGDRRAMWSGGDLLKRAAGLEVCVGEDMVVEEAVNEHLDADQEVLQRLSHILRCINQATTVST